MTNRCVALLNSRAGALKFGPSSNLLAERIKKTGLINELIYTESEEDFSREVAKCVREKVSRLIVSGGDGTVHLAVQQLVGSETALGILPMGTSNNFATALHLPIELGAALTTIKTGQIREVSVGKIGDHYFTESAGVGLFADALALYGAGTNKNVLKALLTTFRLIFSLPRSRMRITLDSKVIVERAAMCTVANAFRFGSSYPIAPEAVLTDEFLDVVIVGDLKHREIPLYYKALRAQSLDSLPKVTTEKSRTIKIESLRSLNVHADDRIIGTTPVEISLIPRALRVITPKL